METGTIIRLRDKADKGLYEVVDWYLKKPYDYHCTVTNDGCDTEHYVLKRDVMLVCQREDRANLLPIEYGGLGYIPTEGKRIIGTDKGLMEV